MKSTLNSVLNDPKNREVIVKKAYMRAEMKAIEQEFINHKGPFLTLQQALDLAKAHQAQQSQQKTA